MNLYDLDSEELAKIKPTHIAYADETSYNTGRFRAVALVTLSIHDSEIANQELKQILKESIVREFKWNRLKSAKNKFAAFKIIDLIINFAVEKRLRIDVITWDVEDSRHKIFNRADIRNLRRMYYFLFRNVLGTRWPKKCIWELRPDETSFNASSHLSYLGNPDEMHEEAREINILRVNEVKSDAEPLVQVADFFAGLGVYSRNSFDNYKYWCRLQLEEQEDSEHNLSNADKERFQVLDYFSNYCKKQKLGVGLNSTNGLRTKSPNQPINFWWYEPQGDYDKAPKWN